MREVNDISQQGAYKAEVGQLLFFDESDNSVCIQRTLAREDQATPACQRRPDSKLAADMSNVGNQTLFLRLHAKTLEWGYSKPMADTSVCMHHSLGATGGATCVHQQRGVVGRSLVPMAERCGSGCQVCKGWRP